jgi:UDP-N-acetylmuramoyl-tripeptide--D-alanyl-D-alanine ligase
VLAALAAAHGLGIGLHEAAGALRPLEPFPARLQPVMLPGGAVVIRDDYNASIDAIEVSLRILEEASAERRVLVITDFSDFGRNRKQRLKFLGAKVPTLAELLVLVGEHHEYGCRRAIEGGMAPCNARGFATLREAAEFLKQELRAGDLVLLKGRTTDHAALCDICWELGLRSDAARSATVVPPPFGEPPTS